MGDRLVGMKVEDFKKMMNEVSAAVYERGFNPTEHPLYNKLTRILYRYIIEIPVKEIQNAGAGPGLINRNQKVSIRDPCKPDRFCEVCGDDRTIDLCHIIPRDIVQALFKMNRKDLIGTGNLQERDNLFFLCPNHHRALDRGTMTREEFRRLDTSAKKQISRDFFEVVLRKRQELYWATNQKPYEILYSPSGYGWGYRYIDDWYDKYGIDRHEVLKHL